MKKFIAKFDLKTGALNLIPVCVFGFFYLMTFRYLEQRDIAVHIIQAKLDNLIPFCEYFIIPYLLWFGYVAVTVFYFAFLKGYKEEYKQLCLTLMSGMVAFVIISFIYPNGQNLRPVLDGSNLFEQLVMKLHQTDTPTNILPSLHVFHSVACCIAVVKNDMIKRNKWITIFTYLLTIGIVLSTMFLKQHSIIDVVMALTMNGVCYYLFYEDAFPTFSVYRAYLKSKHNRKGISL